MTNQTAATILKNLEQSLDDYCELNDEGKVAFRMAVTALELFGNSEQLQNCKTGKWILHPEQEKNIFDVKTIECSECGDKCLVQCVEKEKYCRNCGAKMEGTE